MGEELGLGLRLGLDLGLGLVGVVNFSGLGLGLVGVVNFSELGLRLGYARLGLGVGAAGPTGPTSRQARVSEPTWVTRPTNPRLLANPSHRRKRLLIYRRCRYLFIFPSLIVVLVI